MKMLKNQVSNIIGYPQNIFDDNKFDQNWVWLPSGLERVSNSSERSLKDPLEASLLPDFTQNLIFFNIFTFK